LSSPRLVPKAIPGDINRLNEISSVADDQPSLLLFMFSKDHRYGAISINIFSDDDWSDDFDASMDDSAEIQKIEYQPDEPGLYLPFMKAITAITEQPKMTEHFNF